MKDWIKSGHPVKTIEALPEYNGQFIEADQLKKLMTEFEAKGCTDADGSPALTILDLRTELSVKPDKTSLVIKTSCNTVFCLMDDLKRPEVRNQIPRTGLVVSMTETGNRDLFAMRYLSQFGYNNIKGLLFGMRGWIKADYPTINRQDLKN